MNLCVICKMACLRNRKSGTGSTGKGYEVDRKRHCANRLVSLASQSVELVSQPSFEIILVFSMDDIPNPGWTDMFWVTIRILFLLERSVGRQHVRGRIHKRCQPEMRDVSARAKERDESAAWRYLSQRDWFSSALLGTLITALMIRTDSGW